MTSSLISNISNSPSKPKVKQKAAQLRTFPCNSCPKEEIHQMSTNSLDHHIYNCSPSPPHERNESSSILPPKKRIRLNTSLLPNHCPALEQNSPSSPSSSVSPASCYSLSPLSIAQTCLSLPLVTSPSPLDGSDTEEELSLTEFHSNFINLATKSVQNEQRKLCACGSVLEEFSVSFNESLIMCSNPYCVGSLIHENFDQKIISQAGKAKNNNAENFSVAHGEEEISDINLEDAPDFTQLSLQLQQNHGNNEKIQLSPQITEKISTTSQEEQFLAAFEQSLSSNELLSGPESLGFNEIPDFCVSHSANFQL
jgi:hypothetical protein